MKIPALVSLFLLGSLASAQGVRLGTVKVVIEGFKSQDGQLKVGLEKTAADFDKGPLHEAHYRGEVVPLKSSPVIVYFRDVPFGTYAVKSFHDADGNGVLNTNFVGIPTEDYGFSNNVRGAMGPASFEAARFELDSEEKTISIRVK